MEIIIFEDNEYKNFSPLIHTRSICELKLGMKRLYERVREVYDNTTINLLVRDTVKKTVNDNKELTVDFRIDSSKKYLLINAASVVENRLDISEETIYVTNNKCSHAYVSGTSLLNVNLEEIMYKPFTDVFITCNKVDSSVLTLKYYWDVIRYNGEFITKDFNALNKNNSTTFDNVKITDNTKFLIGKNSTIGYNSFLDTSSGPIIIGDDVKIAEFSWIKGPVYIGDKSEIKPHTQISNGTSIHYNCRVGGEVNNTIFHSFSNKGHHGFIGHAYVGKWVNFGAGATNSNLKNNYGYINVYLNGKDSFKTDMQYLGPAIGDYCKFSINSSINSGSIFGFSANVFSSGELLPKNVESFSWGKNAKFELDKAIDCAEKMMSRRGELLTEVKKEKFKDIYENC